MPSELTLVELMGARFCHDLAGPISAVNNGLEFLQEENPEMRQRAMELIETSSRESVARLQFFRQAYGMVPSEGEVNLSHLQAIAKQYFSFGKITLDWPDMHTEASGIALGHRMGRLLLNLIVIAASSLIHGGTISVRLAKLENGKRLTVIGKGNDLKVSSDIMSILGYQACPIDKRNVQLHFTAQVAQQLGVTVQVAEQVGSLQLMVDRINIPQAKVMEPSEGFITK